MKVSKGASGEIIITADSLKDKDILSAEAWKTLPVYNDPLIGVPEPIEVVAEEQTPAELMLLDGFKCRWWGEEERYRNISPLMNALVSIEMMWDAYRTLPSGDFGLLFPGSPPDENRAMKYWASTDRQRHVNSVVLFNPLRNSIIRVNPREEKSPGDIYLDLLALNDVQLAEVYDFAKARKAMPSPAFLLTIYGHKGEPILRGVLFLQRLKGERVESPASDSDGPS